MWELVSWKSQAGKPIISAVVSFERFLTTLTTRGEVFRILVCQLSKLTFSLYGHRLLLY